MATSSLPGCLQWLADVSSVGVSAASGRIGPIVPVGTGMIGGGGQVIVFDGPEVSFDESVYTQRIWIGHDPVNQEVAAASSEQEFAAINQAQSRYETFDITLACQDYSGDTTMKTHRNNVYALMAQIELFVRGMNGYPGDSAMGGACMYSQVAGPTELYYEQMADGASATLIFHITGKARLT